MLRDKYSDDALRSRLSRYDNIVIWGLKHSHSSHRFIFSAYAQAMDRLGVPYVWVDDSDTNGECGPNDLVLIYGASANIERALDGDPYLIDFHVLNKPNTITSLSDETRDRIIASEKRLSDMEHHARDIDGGGEMLDPLTYLCPSKRYLAQPWGSDLHPDEFLPANPNLCSTDVFFNGSVWKSRWGNYEEIEALRAACDKFGLRLFEVSNAETRQNATLIQNSRFAPTIAGRGQAHVNYLACRFFKNISYGQYCFSNVPLSKTLLGRDVVFADDLEKAVRQILSIPGKRWINSVRRQQAFVRKYTIFQHLFLTVSLMQDGF